MWLPEWTSDVDLDLSGKKERRLLQSAVHVGQVVGATGNEIVRSTDQLWDRVSVINNGSWTPVEVFNHDVG